MDFAAVPKGPKGDKGDKGDPGAPGTDATQVVLATGSDSTTTDIDIGTFNSVVDPHQLRSVITTSAPSRIVAQASAMFKDTSANATPADTRCKLSLDDPPPVVSTGTLISQEISARMPISSTATHTNLAVVGRSAQLPAGTYYVTLHCLSDEPGATFDAGDLTVLAVAS